MVTHKFILNDYSFSYRKINFGFLTLCFLTFTMRLIFANKRKHISFKTEKLKRALFVIARLEKSLATIRPLIKSYVYALRFFYFCLFLF